MPRATALTKSIAPGNYPAAGVAVTFTAADATNKDQFVFSGGELVIANNTGATSRTVTLTSVANSKGRVKHITADTLAAGAFKMYGPFKDKTGWAQSGGLFYLEASHAEVKFAVVKL